jgi:transposase, IS6 family
MLLCVRWYLRDAFSYRDLEEMRMERGLTVDHTTISRWVQHDAPELDKRCRSCLKVMHDSWRVDATDVKIKGSWMYLSRAMDAHRKTLEFLRSPTRDAEAAKRFFSKMLASPHTTVPGVITLDKTAASPKAVNELKAAGVLAESCEVRQVKDLKNRVEQDHRCIKRSRKPGMGFFSFETAQRALQGEEVKYGCAGTGALQ